MKKQTFGATVSALRRQRGMTQMELAEQMGVTDKAVSKWERDLSLPDVTTLAKLAAVFGISVDELLQAQTAAEQDTEGKEGRGLVGIALKGVALAMGVAVAVLSFVRQIEVNDAGSMLGLGLACLAVCELSRADRR